MTELLIHLFTGLWGCLLFSIIFLVFMALTYTLISFMWNRFWRHWNIRKHGYPPPHCDADGDPIEGFTDKTKNVEQ